MCRTLKVLIAAVAIAQSGTLFAQTFTVGVEDLAYYPHYEYKDGNYGGYARAVLDEFAASAGYEFEYVARPVPRLYAGLLDGSFDFKYPDNANWAGDLKQGKTLAYSDPVAAYVDGLMVPSDASGIDVASLSSLGTLAGFTPWAYKAQIDAGDIKLAQRSTMGSLLKSVIAGRIDGAYVNIDVARYFLDEVLGQSGALTFSQDLPKDEGVYALSSVAHPQIIEEFNQFMDEKSARIEELKREYGLSD